jgi:hypothetical protein
MSSILKALKKAEQDCNEQSSDNKFSSKFNVRTSLNSKIRQQRDRFLVNTKRVVFSLGMIVVAAVASYIIFFENINIQPKRPIHKIVSQPSATIPVEQKVEKMIVQQPIVEAITLPEAGQKKDANLKKSYSLPGDEIIPVFETRNLEHPKKKSQTPLLPISNSKIEKKDINDTPAISDILPLNDGILKLQAVSWAEEPTARVAIINNKILEEGESVQGYLLLLIKKDDVILQHSGKKYKLDFKYR